jgi:cytochrome c-type biogenesis protein CcmH/NrfG
VPLYAELGKFEEAYQCLAKDVKAHPENRQQALAYAVIIYLGAEKQLGKEKRDELFDELGKKYPMRLLGPADPAQPDGAP